MAEQTPDNIITTQRNGQTIVAECFCAAVIEKQLRNNGLPVPLRRDDTVGVPGRGGRPVLFCHRRLLSPGAEVFEADGTLCRLYRPYPRHSQRVYQQN